MLPRKVYVIGAGLAGLAAAVRLAGLGEQVTVIEAAAQAGGRCRSFFDAALGMTIDNGNHLVLSGNHAVMAYLETIGASERLAGPAEARFDFCDVRDGTRWTIRPNPGPLAWWALSPRRRVPGTRAIDYLALLALAGPQGRRTLAEATPTGGALWERLIEPLMLAALNEEPASGSAGLASAVVRETLALGGRAYRPRIADPTLEAAFVAPALAYLEARGAKVRLGRRLEAIVRDETRAGALTIARETLELGPEDWVVLATPPWITASLLPGVTAPDAFNAIVNGHFRIGAARGAPRMVGVIGGTAQWLFSFEGRISATVSAANRLAEAPAAVVAQTLWADVARVYGLGPELPPWRIIKERRATFAATPDQVARRPGTRTRLANLVLAGDWTDTGLPATIEGAIRSGQKAANVVARRSR